MRWVTLAAAALTVAACSQEGSGYRLRLGHDQTERHPYHLGVQRFAERVAEASGGAIQVSIFPAAQLGDSP